MKCFLTFTCGVVNLSDDDISFLVSTSFKAQCLEFNRVNRSSNWYEKINDDN